MKHKTSGKIIFFTGITTIIIILSFALFSVATLFDSKPRIGYLDFNEIYTAIPDTEQIGVYRGVGGFKAYMETVTEGKTGTLMQYQEGWKISIHRSFNQTGYDVSHLTLNRTMHSFGVFHISLPDFQNGYQYTRQPLNKTETTK